MGQRRATSAGWSATIRDTRKTYLSDRINRGVYNSYATSNVIDHKLGRDPAGDISGVGDNKGGSVNCWATGL